ncbi:RNA-binding domain-containing protein [Delitschia confertaspora ATCC 74209]|uniref:RNA-binding domain-containing protein n=1 Tax=Delitschia confertaspora ATCC 74209 TaxID=1513339 RepID=A0A9P4JVF8_9PLEO|nr:RNA-binding domain-containing protein [Delitschia confertaspora ATCC 74209]
MSGTGGRHWEQDKEATVYIGNLDERVTDQLVWELMLQAGRIQNVHLPKDRVSQTHSGYGFVEFLTEEDADYAAKIMNNIRLFGKAIRVNKASADKQKNVEIGAELFIGNLDSMVDEKTLYDTFSRFGTLTSVPKVARHEDNMSKGYGFVSFADFEASDAAIANMNGQYLMNKEISVQYAYKKDGKGERHGDEAERMLAAQAKAHGVQPVIQPLPPQLFQAPPIMPTGPPQGAPLGPSGGPPGAYGGAGGYNNVPPPHQQHGRGPPGPPTPLPPPPSGLPARPPPSHGGLNGPPQFMQPGYANTPPPMQGFAPPAPPPPGFGGPPPPGQMPPGFAPPGYQQRR